MIHILIAASLVLLLFLTKTQFSKMHYTAQAMAEADNEENVLAFSREFFTMIGLCIGWLAVIVVIYFTYWG